MKKIYLAGPMTGHPDSNFPAFHAEAARLRELGHQVVNPAEINLDPAAAWLDCLRQDLPQLLECHGIHLLPGWQHSRGARLEHHIATALEYEISLAEGAAHAPTPAVTDDARDAARGRFMLAWLTYDENAPEFAAMDRAAASAQPVDMTPAGLAALVDLAIADLAAQKN